MKAVPLHTNIVLSNKVTKLESCNAMRLREGHTPDVCVEAPLSLTAPTGKLEGVISHMTWSLTGVHCTHNVCV